MAAHRKDAIYHDELGEVRITEDWYVDDDPVGAENDAQLPQPSERHGDSGQVPAKPSCRVVSRDLEVHHRGPDTGKTIATIVFSNRPDNVPPDTDEWVMVRDMMGRTERQYVDLDNPTQGIGVNHEGAEVFRPHQEFVFRHYETVVNDIAIQNCSGKTNDRPWKGYPQATMLFVGARTEQRTLNRVMVEYHFIYDASENKAYWRPYKEEEGTEGAGGGAVNTVIRIYGDEQDARVYDQANFYTLPI